jgi:5'-nucleotidase
MAAMRILVTNDDGIDSIGLHRLTMAMCDLDGDHEIVIVAPDKEYSGAGAAIGALHLMQPEVHRTAVRGLEDVETWSVGGPPALCVMFARLGALGAAPDLVVSGINPGANVGRAVYHSGTVGATLTARNGRISGVAVSQSVAGFGVEGQGWDEMIADQRWDTAAIVARHFVQALIEDLPKDPIVANLNVPNLELDEITGWRHAEIGVMPPRAMHRARLEPIAGHDDAYTVEMEWGDEMSLPPETDTGTIEENKVSVSFLSRLEHVDRPDVKVTAEALDALLG